MTALLLLGFLFPLILLFWPFAQWSFGPALVLRTLSAFSAQLLFLSLPKRNALQLLPLTVTGLIALWGSFLYLTSPHWANATFVGYMADYVSPFAACCLTYISNRTKK